MKNDTFDGEDSMETGGEHTIPQLTDSSLPHHMVTGVQSCS